VHFSVNRMLTADCFKQRFERGLSFLEFNYMILQSYDFYHLAKTKGCTVQMGGDDQWSNILAGMDLVRRKMSVPSFCLTVPLLVNGQGQKMGKTEKGALWLAPELTSPFDFFQFFRNIDDDMVEKCLNYFTELPAEEVLHLGSLRDKAINEAKIVLAFEVTKLLHGEEEATKAKAQAASLFTGAKPSDVGEAPEVVLGRTTFLNEVNVVDLLVSAQIFASKSDARRMIQQGGVSINGEKVEDIALELPLSEIEGDKGILVRKGKKHYHRIIIR